MIIDTNKNKEQITIKSNCEQLHTMVSNSAYKLFSSLKGLNKEEERNIYSELSLFFFYQIEYDKQTERGETSSKIPSSEYKNENLFNTLCDFLFAHKKHIDNITIRDFVELIFFLKTFPFVPIFTDENGIIEGLSDWVVDISHNHMRYNLFKLYESFSEHENSHGDKLFDSFLKTIQEHNKNSENYYAMNDNTLENAFKQNVFNSNIPLHIAINVSMQKLGDSEQRETAVEQDNICIPLYKPYGEKYETVLEQVLSLFKKEHGFSADDKIDTVFRSFV